MQDEEVGMGRWHVKNLDASTLKYVHGCNKLSIMHANGPSHAPSVLVTCCTISLDSVCAGANHTGIK